MWSFFSEARVRWLGVLWCALIIGGLFAARWVRVLPSVGIVGLFLTSVVYAWQAAPRAGRRPLAAVLSLGLVWLLHLATGLLHTSPTDPALWQDLLLESPFLLLPVAFWLLPPWRPAHARFLWLLLLGCCLVAAAGSTINYLLNQEAVEDSCPVAS